MLVIAGIEYCNAKRGIIAVERTTGQYQGAGMHLILQVVIMLVRNADFLFARTFLIAFLAARAEYGINMSALAYPRFTPMSAAIILPHFAEGQERISRVASRQRFCGGNPL